MIYLISDSGNNIYKIILTIKIQGNIILPNKIKLIQRGRGTGPMMPDNQHSHSNVVVLIPADAYLRDKDNS